MGKNEVSTAQARAVRNAVMRGSVDNPVIVCVGTLFTETRGSGSVRWSGTGG